MCSTRHASRSARSTASTRATGCSTSTPMSASTAGPVSRSARSRRSSTRTTCRSSGRTTRRRTTSSSRTSARPAAPPRSARSTRTPPFVAAQPPRRERALTAVLAVRAAAGLPLGSAGAGQGGRGRAPGRHRRPVHRHARSTRCRAVIRAALADGVRRARLPADRRHAGAARGDRRLGGAAPAAPSGELRRAADDRLQGAGRLAAHAARRRPRRRRGHPGGLLPDVRGRAPGWPAPTVVRSDSLTALGPDPRVRLVWVNSPSNPTGRVLPGRRTCARWSTGRASAARSWPATSAT